MSGMLYRKADDIADGLTERLTISPDISEGMVAQLLSMVDSNPFSTPGLVPATAGAGAVGNTVYSPTYVQYITTPKPITAAEATREAQDLMKRMQNQLP